MKPSKDALIDPFENKNTDHEAIQGAKALEGADFAKSLRHGHELRVDDAHDGDDKGENGQPAVLGTAAELSVGHFITAGQDVLLKGGVDVGPD